MEKNSLELTTGVDGASSPRSTAVRHEHPNNNGTRRQRPGHPPVGIGHADELTGWVIWPVVFLSWIIPMHRHLAIGKAGYAQRWRR